MAFRYRKSIKVMPGVRMTFSKSGVSYSAGTRGARITKTASGRVTRTVGIPGTGLSHTSSLGSSSRGKAASGPATAPTPAVPVKPPKPGLLASKGEKALYAAADSNDVGALERVSQEHPSEAIVSASLAALLHVRDGNTARARELLDWVLNTGREPTEHPLYRKYISAEFSLKIAPGVTVRLAPSRDALGLMYAELCQDDGDLTAAIETVEGLDPNTITAVSLADLYSAAERHDDVIDLTNGITNEDDATALLCTYRGQALRALGHHVAAREALKEALKTKKRDNAIRHQAYIERALVYLDEGKKAQARKEAEKVMAEDRSHPDLAALLAAIDGPSTEDSGTAAPTAAAPWAPPSA